MHLGGIHKLCGLVKGISKLSMSVHKGEGGQGHGPHGVNFPLWTLFPNHDLPKNCEQKQIFLIICRKNMLINVS